MFRVPFSSSELRFAADETLASLGFSQLKTVVRWVDRSTQRGMALWARFLCGVQRRGVGPEELTPRGTPGALSRGCRGLLCRAQPARKFGESIPASRYFRPSQ